MSNDNPTVPAVKPAGDKPPRPRKRKPAQPAAVEDARFLDTPDAQGRQMLLIRARGVDFYYIVEPLYGQLDSRDGVQLVGYRLWKDLETSYDVHLDAEALTCECLGWLRWHKPCKHMLGIIKATGRDADEQLKTALRLHEYKPGGSHSHGLPF